MTELILTDGRSPGLIHKVDVLPARKQPRVWNWISRMFLDLKAGGRFWNEYDKKLLRKL
jgi:hypothetical protein